jgi:hypothetical protein
MPGSQGIASGLQRNAGNLGNDLFTKLGAEKVLPGAHPDLGFSSWNF